MALDYVVRPAEPADVHDLAKVHVDTWRETYRGLMSDTVLDDPGLLSWRERFWVAALTDPRYDDNVIAVASRDGSLIGIAMAGPTSGASDAPQQLYVLYVYAAFHGSGAGSALLDAVIDGNSPAVLWVADPNPRAHAFYRKHGFVPDGAVQINDGVREIRMVHGVSGAACF